MDNSAIVYSGSINYWCVFEKENSQIVTGFPKNRRANELSKFFDILTLMRRTFSPVGEGLVKMKLLCYVHSLQLLSASNYYFKFIILRYEKR